MDFNSLNFIFLFLPFFLLLFLLSDSAYRKWLILIASAIFYYLFQGKNLPFMLGLILINYFILLLLGANEEKIKFRKIIFWFAICANLFVLLFYKIATSSTWMNSGPPSGGKPGTLFDNLLFPIGLSFITFQILSCLIDSYHAKETAPKNLLDYFSYLLFFPKIVVGPIMKFDLFESQFNNLHFSWVRFADGAKRFIKGLAKKALIADQLAVVVNAGFGLEKPGFSTSVAWILLIAFFIQIYYDFSGYIDMGLGIAHMVGFDLPENFNVPYLSKSLTEFWRRWHITLMAWFREYVFYPLEYVRKKEKFIRLETDTILIFLLSGLWHGLTLPYIVWGILQGIVIVFENSRVGKWIQKLPSFLQRIYFIGVILISWVIFRSPSLGFALRFFKRLIVVNQNVQLYPYSVTQPLPIIDNSIYLCILIGIFGLFPLSKILEKPRLKKIFQSASSQTGIALGYFVLFIISVAFVVSQNFIPSIYGKF